MSNKKIHSFSIIVAAYNEENYISDCIRSLQQQDYGGLFEIIIVDNGSTDKTASLARSFNVQVIHEPTRGVSHALIAGSKAAKGGILAFTDADTRPPQTWLSQFNETFNLNEQIVGVGGPPIFYDGPRWANIVMEKFLVKLYMNFFHKREHGLAGCNMAIRAQVYHASGGFKPGFNWGQDWKMGHRASGFGDVIFDPAIYVHTSFRRFHGNHKNPVMRNARIFKELAVGLTRMVPMVFFNKNLKAQKPIR